MLYNVGNARLAPKDVGLSQNFHNKSQVHYIITWQHSPYVTGHCAMVQYTEAWHAVSLYVIITRRKVGGHGETREKHSNMLMYDCILYIPVNNSSLQYWVGKRVGLVCKDSFAHKYFFFHHPFQNRIKWQCFYLPCSLQLACGTVPGISLTCVHK